MNRNQLLAMWRFEERFPFGGWDFSHLDGRWQREPLPWDYLEEARALLRPNARLLELDAGDGANLLSLRHPYELCAVTEYYGPDYEACVSALAPLGVRVARCDADREPLPFPDNSFDLILCRHGGYQRDELFRALRPGGLFITEQVGLRNNRALAKRLLPDYEPAFPEHDLRRAAQAFCNAGFTVLRGEEYFPKLRFLDVGALVYYAGVVPWEFPGFSVERCGRELLCLEAEREERGGVDSIEHLFFLVAQKAG